MRLCRINKASDVLLPAMNPSCAFASIRFSFINFISRWFKIAEKNFPKHDNNEMPL